MKSSNSKGCLKTLSIVVILGFIILSKNNNNSSIFVNRTLNTQISINSRGELFLNSEVEPPSGYRVEPVTIVVDDSTGEVRISIFDDKPSLNLDESTFDFTIQINEVQLLHTDGDNGTGAEAYFVMFATREYGEVKKAKLVIPPDTDTVQMRVGDSLDLSSYSFGINNVQDVRDEEIAIYIMGLDNDEQSELTNFALDAALAIAESAVPGSSFIKFVLSSLSGKALEWWQNEDLLGEFSLVLNKNNNWLEGTHSAVSANGNLWISYTIRYLE